MEERAGWIGIVVAAPAVRMDDCIGTDAPANNGLQRLFPAVRDNLGINRTVTLEDAEDNRFAARAATAFSPHSACAEVTFVHFDCAAKRRCSFAFFSNAATNFQVNLIDRLSGQSDDFRRFRGGQIERKAADNSPRFSLANFGTPVITV